MRSTRDIPLVHAFGAAHPALGRLSRGTRPDPGSRGGFRRFGPIVQATNATAISERHQRFEEEPYHLAALLRSPVASSTAAGRGAADRLIVVRAGLRHAVRAKRRNLPRASAAPSAPGRLDACAPAAPSLPAKYVAGRVERAAGLERGRRGASSGPPFARDARRSIASPETRVDLGAAVRRRERGRRDGQERGPCILRAPF